MNRFWNLRRGIILSLFVALALNGLARPVENRYLFIVETSSAMKRDSAEAQRILLDLVFSGLHGRMKLNDSFGVWTYSAHLQGRLPMQYWNAEEKYSISQNVAEFIKDQKFKGEGHLEEPLQMATKIATASSNLTVIVISDGKEPVTGTPFDHDIADLQKKYRDDLYKSKIPFVTVLVANEGKWIDYSVNSSIGAIQIPEIPLPPPPPVVAPPTVVTAPPPRKKVEPLILIWPKTNAAKSVAESSAPKPVPPAPSPVTNNAALITNVTPVVAPPTVDNATNSAPTVTASTPVATPPVPPVAQASATQPVPVTAAAPQSQTAPTPEKPASSPVTTTPVPTATAAATPAPPAPVPVAAPSAAIATPIVPAATAPPKEVEVAPPTPIAAVPAPVTPTPAAPVVLAKEQIVSATPPTAPIAPAAPTPSPTPEEKVAPPIAVPIAATPTPPANNRIVLIAAVLAFIGAGSLLLMRIVGRKKTSSLITQSLRRQDHHDTVN